MKISKNHLKRIIREEIENLSYNLDKGILDIEIDNDFPSDVEADEDSWAGGQNLNHQVDHTNISCGEENVRGVEVLKITEDRVKNIVKSFMMLERHAEDYSKKKSLKEHAESDLNYIMPMLDKYDRYADENPVAEQIYELLFSLQERLNAIIQNRD